MNQEGTKGNNKCNPKPPDCNTHVLWLKARGFHAYVNACAFAGIFGIIKIYTYILLTGTTVGMVWFLVLDSKT